MTKLENKDDDGDIKSYDQLIERYGTGTAEHCALACVCVLVRVARMHVRMYICE